MVVQPLFRRSQAEAWVEAIVDSRSSCNSHVYSKSCVIHMCFVARSSKNPLPCISM